MCKGPFDTIKSVTSIVINLVVLSCIVPLSLSSILASAALSETHRPRALAASTRLQESANKWRVTFDISQVPCKYPVSQCGVRTVHSELFLLQIWPNTCHRSTSLFAWFSLQVCVTLRISRQPMRASGLPEGGSDYMQYVHQNHPETMRSCTAQQMSEAVSSPQCCPGRC